jgi:hypothetical protein
MEAVDLATCAFFSEGCQDFALGVRHLPAWPFGIKISRAFLTDICRAVHDLPARFSAFRDI